MKWLIFPVGLAACVGFGGLGYLWFGVLGWQTLEGQIAFGAAGVAYALLCIWALSRLRLGGPVRQVPVYAAPASAQASGGGAERREWEAKRNRRIVELLADPAKEKYVERAQQGDLITDFEIAYLEDPSLSVLCVHLREVEAAMRAAGIPARPVMNGYETFSGAVGFGCAVDMVRLKRQFALDRCVVWEEIAEFGYEEGRVQCRSCKMRLGVSLLVKGSNIRVFPPE